ncbi:MAG: glycine cleavage system protein GcvH [Desulforegulaceae bacterium]|nr:glycine cleavage system protein GcvH [Desulforegulaceae bacterium]
MKEINELNLPENIFYTDQHEWVETGEVVKVGVSDYAQDQLGDIVFVELPEVGDSFEKGDECATLESVKAVSEIYCPVSGEVVEINEALEDEPGLINEDPYEKGWMFKVKVEGSIDGLMDKAAYLAMLKGE